MGIVNALLKWWRRNRCRPEFWFVAVSTLFVVAGAVVLEKMEHPWEGMTGKRIELGRPWLAEDYGRYWGFWMGTLATVAIALVTILSRWWWPRAHPSKMPEIPERRRFHWLAWVILVAILLLAAWMRIPKLDGPLLRDEQDTLRYHVHGFYFHDRKNDDALTFKTVTWAEAAFWNPMGNNPVLMSVLSKATIDVWRSFTGSPEDRFSHVALRLPAFLAGLASIAALAWFVLAFAPQRVALLAALLATIHPFHMEYCDEARGYAFVMLGSAIALGSAIRAFRHGYWRYWVGLTAGSALMLYAYLGSVFFVAPFALTAVILALWRWRRAVASGDQSAVNMARRNAIRLGVAGIVGVCLYLVLAIPPAVCFWVNREHFPRTFTPSGQWWAVFWTEFASGHLFQMSHSTDGSLAPLSELVDSFLKPQPLLWFEIFIAPLLVVAGLVSVWRKPDRGAALLLGVAFLTPFAQIAVHALVTHMVLFYFYLIYWLPVIIALEAAGIDALITFVIKRLPPVGEPDVRPIRGRLGWATLAAGFFFLIFAAISPDRIPKTWQPVGRPQTPVAYDRGEAHWIVFPEGRTLKLDRGQPVPDRFPDPVRAARVKGGGTITDPSTERRGSP